MVFDQRVPVIDLGPFTLSHGSPQDKLVVAKQVDAACRDLGFLVVKGHGVPPQLIQDMHAVYMAFFSVPLEQKLEWAIGRHSPFAGYVQPGNSYLAKTAKINAAKLQPNGPGATKVTSNGPGKADASPPDLKESFGIGPPKFPREEYYTCERGQMYFKETPWPASPLQPDLQTRIESVTMRYWEHLEVVTTQLLGAMALGLNLPEDFFVPFMDKHISHLFVQHYPLQELDPVPGQIRAGAHTDFGGVTILHLGSNPDGLEVWERRRQQGPRADDGHDEDESHEDEKGVWTPVTADEDCFVINLGDLMQQWTNDVWKSTLHRVVNPMGQTRATSIRQTITYFNQPNYDAVIECIPTLLPEGASPTYAPITSGEHYNKKLAAIREVQRAAAG